MLDIKKATGTGAVNDLVQRVGFCRLSGGVKGDILGREVVRFAIATGLIADILVSSTAVLLVSGGDGRLRRWRRVGMECGTWRRGGCGGGGRARDGVE